MCYVYSLELPYWGSSNEYGKCPKISYIKIANSAEPDYISPEGTVWSESTLIAIN